MPLGKLFTDVRNRRLAASAGLIGLLAVGLTACGNDDPAAIPTQQPPPTQTQQPAASPTQSATSTAVPSQVKVAMSPLERETADAPEADVNALVDGNTQFALDLYQALREEDGNLFYSPYSISLALAMTYAGARGETEQQMAETLNFALEQGRLHPAFNTLDRHLTSLGENVQEDQGTAFQLSIANSIWGQDGFEFLDEYLDTLAENYGAGLRLVDYENAPEEARQQINAWVEDQTEERIKDLLQEGVITPDVRLVLANAIYFKASWVHQFDEQDTAPGTFNLLDGSTVQVPMMHQSARIRYEEGEGFQAVELPYAGYETSMVVILPDEGEFQQFEGALDASQLQAIVESLGDSQVTLTMPKFEFDSSLGLADTLKAMGMPVAFSDMADFSGMTGQPGLTIYDVVHKAFVAVDEKGTEAAAATGVVEGPTSMPQPATMTVDRPFIFLIRDMETGTVLFLGRVLEPGV